jgi:uncharacterized protein (TIGR00299 family) protein
MCSIAYFDCFSGAAGDMILGAMLDGGLPFNHLKRELAKLHLKNYTLRKKIEHRGAFGGVNLQVIFPPPLRGGVRERGHSHYKDIVRLISKSALNKNIRETALAIFETIAKAEAHVHRMKIDSVHFHEVGAIDSIVDIAGAAIGFDYFKFDSVYASLLPITRGFINGRHGRMPIPAPATLEILKDVPIVASPVKGELVTPTGAAILKTVVTEFGENPITKIKRTGYGHGDNHFKEIPNSLRLIIGEGQKLIALETNIDDMNPQIYDYVIERLLKAGALDVIVMPVMMKKRRPGAFLQVLCAETVKNQLIDIILRETTTFGVRYYPVARKILDREIKPAKTKYGLIRVKLGFANGSQIKAVPEYEDCKKIAAAKGIPLKEIYGAFASIHC